MEREYTAGYSAKPEACPCIVDDRTKRKKQPRRSFLLRIDRCTDRKGKLRDRQWKSRNQPVNYRFVKS